MVGLVLALLLTTRMVMLVFMPLDRVTGQVPTDAFRPRASANPVRNLGEDRP